MTLASFTRLHPVHQHPLLYITRGACDISILYKTLSFSRQHPLLYITRGACDINILYKTTSFSIPHPLLDITRGVRHYHPLQDFILYTSILYYTLLGGACDISILYKTTSFSRQHPLLDITPLQDSIL